MNSDLSRFKALVCGVGLVGCVGGDGVDSALDSGGGLGCDPVTDDTREAIVTDIDETLTTDDTEWIHQILDSDYDPAMRPDADTLMNGYFERGYRVFYVTARGEDLSLLDGTGAREATEAWLDSHGFPYRSEDVFLADGLGATGTDAVDYKSGVLTDRAAAGYTTAWAYGNAETDIQAYQAFGLADDHIFLVGDLAGTLGVEPIPTADAYTNHLADFLPSVGCAGGA